MLTVAEYLAKADDLETRAAQCAPGTGRDAYSEMADQWRRLAARAEAAEAFGLQTPSMGD